MSKAPRTFEKWAKDFWASVNMQHDDDQCWPWLCGTVRGYGQYCMSYRGRTISHRAPRVAFALANGGIDPELEVLHSCHNPLCCNPRHLRQDTHLENVRDMHRAGRHAKKKRFTHRAPRQQRTYTTIQFTEEEVI